MRRFGHKASIKTVQIGLEPLANITASGPQEEILATCWLMVLAPCTRVAMLVEGIGFFDGRDIEAPMFRKLLIFRRHDRER